MAILVNPPHGNLKGKDGGIVYCTRYGVTYIRSRPEVYHDKKSEAQLLQRARFWACGMCYTVLKRSPSFTSIWRAAAAGMHISGYHLFRKVNTNAFDINGDLYDYRKFHISKGTLQQADGFIATRKDSGTIHVKWEQKYWQNTASPSDRLGVLLFWDDPEDKEDKDRFLLLDPQEWNIQRKDGEACIEVPDSSVTEICIYCFWASAENDRFSDDICMILS